MFCCIPCLSFCLPVCVVACAQAQMVTSRWRWTPGVWGGAWAGHKLNKNNRFKYR
jgi:hypothetical protein